MEEDTLPFTPPDSLNDSNGLFKRINQDFYSDYICTWVGGKQINSDQVTEQNKHSEHGKLLFAN